MRTRASSVIPVAFFFQVWWYPGLAPGNLQGILDGRYQGDFHEWMSPVLLLVPLHDYETVAT